MNPYIDPRSNGAPKNNSVSRRVIIIDRESLAGDYAAQARIKQTYIKRLTIRQK